MPRISNWNLFYVQIDPMFGSRGQLPGPDSAMIPNSHSHIESYWRSDNQTLRIFHGFFTMNFCNGEFEIDCLIRSGLRKSFGTNRNLIVENPGEVYQTTYLGQRDDM